MKELTQRPIEVMVKTAGAQCNLRCDYCYYLDKLASSDAHLTPISGASKAQMMTEQMLEQYVRSYIKAQPEGVPVRFVWHGGEALLRPISFYQKALDLQQVYGKGREIENILQTNGTLLTEEWCRFFVSNQFLVGISIDGTERQHNAYRKGMGGGATFSRVMRGIELLNRFGVEYNILSTVNAINAQEPHEYYEFVRQLGTPFIQFTPIVERISKVSHRSKAWGGQVEAPYLSLLPKDRLLFDQAGVEMAEYSIRSEAWGYFLVEVFDSWVRRDVGSVYIQIIENTLANWCGLPAGLCTLSKTCGQAGIVEYNGDLYSCDHYVYPRHLLGNIGQNSLGEMMNSPQQQYFGEMKYKALTNQCKECEYLFACHGECPKNRFAYSQEGEPGHNYLCGGYYRFWKHITPYMDYMKACLMQGADPRMVMYWNPA